MNSTETVEDTTKALGASQFVVNYTTPSSEISMHLVQITARTGSSLTITYLNDSESDDDLWTETIPFTETKGSSGFRDRYERELTEAIFANDNNTTIKLLWGEDDKCYETVVDEIIVGKTDLKFKIYFLEDKTRATFDSNTFKSARQGAVDGGNIGDGRLVTKVDATKKNCTYKIVEAASDNASGGGAAAPAAAPALDVPAPAAAAIPAATTSATTGMTGITGTGTDIDSLGAEDLVSRFQTYQKYHLDARKPAANGEKKLTQKQTKLLWQMKDVTQRDLKRNEYFQDQEKEAKKKKEALAKSKKEKLERERELHGLSCALHKAGCRVKKLKEEVTHRCRTCGLPTCATTCGWVLEGMLNFFFFILFFDTIFW